MTTNRVPVVDGMFAETADGARLLGSKCAGCGAPYFPKSAVCHNPRCREKHIEPASFGPRGTLWSFAVQHYAPPAPVKYDEPYKPYALGLVDLRDGLRVLGRLQVDKLENLKIGMDVELIVARLCADKDGNEVTTWMFKPL